MNHEGQKKFVERRVAKDRRELIRQQEADLNKRVLVQLRRWTDREKVELVNNKTIGK